MGSTIDFIGATFADALTPKLRRPVEDIIYETLDRKQIPSRTDFNEMRDTINGLRSQTNGASSGINKIKTGLDDLEEGLHNLETQIVDLVTRLQHLEDENATLKNGANTDNSSTITLEQIQELITAEVSTKVEQILSQSKQTNTSKSTEKAPVSKSQQNSCSVEGCSTTARGYGFCQKHYGRWRRGTLKGFVLYDGSISHNDHNITIGDDYKGKAYEIQDGNVIINSEVVHSL